MMLELNPKSASVWLFQVDQQALPGLECAMLDETVVPVPLQGELLPQRYAEPEKKSGYYVPALLNEHSSDNNRQSDR